LAIAQPDLRDLDLFLEQEFFWFEHYMLMAVPVYFIMTRKYFIFPISFSFIVASFFSKALFHSMVLGSVGIMNAVNLNYMLSPPPGM
jgi:hypothetical protein